MKPTSLALAVLTFGLAMLVPTRTNAAILATFNISGSQVALSSTGLDFQCTAAIVNAPCPGPAGTGNISVNTPTGDMAAYANEAGYIKDLLFSSGLNVPLLLSDFLTFSGGPVGSPAFEFDLGFINLGIYSPAACGGAPAAGQTCTPAYATLVSPADPLGLSPLNFVNTINGSTVSFTMSGTRRNLLDGTTASFTAEFTAQSNLAYQTVLASLANGGSYSTTFSGTVTVTGADAVVPEPATSVLLGSGLALTAFIRRRAARARN